MRYELNKINRRDNMHMRFFGTRKFVLPVSCFYVSNVSDPSVLFKLSIGTVLFLS